MVTGFRRFDHRAWCDFVAICRVSQYVSVARCGNEFAFSTDGPPSDERLKTTDTSTGATGSVNCDAHVSKFPAESVYAADELAVGNRTSADSCAETQVNHFGRTLRRTKPRLTHNRAIGIIFNNYIEAGERCKPVAQRIVEPSREIGSEMDDSSLGIERSWSRDADDGRVIETGNFYNRCNELGHALDN